MVLVVISWTAAVHCELSSLESVTGFSLFSRKDKVLTGVSLGLHQSTRSISAVPCGRILSHVCVASPLQTLLRTTQINIMKRLFLLIGQKTAPVASLPRPCPILVQWWTLTTFMWSTPLQLSFPSADRKRHLDHRRPHPCSLPFSQDYGTYPCATSEGSAWLRTPWRRKLCSSNAAIAKSSPRTDAARHHQ